MDTAVSSPMRSTVRVVAPKVCRATLLRWKYSTLFALIVPSSRVYGRNAIATGFTLGRRPAIMGPDNCRHTLTLTADIEQRQLFIVVTTCVC